jgi:uncharacterized protein (TIGR01319 family)
MKVYLLADFGSTYTKLTAVDLELSHILATTQCPTTVKTDIAEGLNHATAEIENQIGKFEIEALHACSSAAGGLRMVVSGLVEELTAEAARVAALGAGARVIRVFSNKMTKADVRELETIQPDLFLLTGGTDGGDEQCILANAATVAKLNLTCPILIAGNRQAADECFEILSAAGKESRICPNVLPKLGTLNIQPVQEEIRALFLKRIIQAKGLSRVTRLLDDIMMPTPVAVLKALTLLAHGTDKECGIGPLMAVDLGGATCDVYSISAGSPKESNTVMRGLPEPEAKRTVEGDIGMRINAYGVVEAAGGLERLTAMSGVSMQETTDLLSQFSENPSVLPETAAMEQLDKALASLALEVSTIRHAGTISEAYTPAGLMYIQEGKDLRDIRQLLFIGGTLIRTRDPQTIAEYSRYSPARPESLRPEQFDLYLDKRYILSAMGVLSEIHPNEALRLMKKEICFE